MSLVAYDSSSDDSEYEDNEESNKTKAVVDKPPAAQPKSNKQEVLSTINGQISDDEDDDYLEHSEDNFKSSSWSLSLPKPKKEETIQEIVGNLAKTSFGALPTPKIMHNQNGIKEEDDEFLHKKDNFESNEIKPPTFTPTTTKGPVKISVPSLKDFDDVQKEMLAKSKSTIPIPNENKMSRSSGLLSILPKAKSERSFSKSESHTDKNGEISGPTRSASTALIPDTVKYRRPAHSTEGVNDDSNTAKKIISQKKKPNVISCSDDEDNATTKVGLDFFSLQADDDCLPDVSANEISMMVAKKAAKIAEATNKYLSESESKVEQENELKRRNQDELDMARQRFQESQLDADATRALVGSSAKRRRNQHEQISVMDLNSDQILPNREEWMRTALASSTTYQPTGVLVDEEPAAGTKRKHQITYLAHKAKANEAELQAIWAANRQTRRATQSKYGF